MLFRSVMPVLSGRAVFRVFIYSDAPAQGVAPVLRQGCVAVANAATLGLPLQPNGLANDGSVWQEWTGGVQEQPNFPPNARAYSIRYWLPVKEEQYLASYTAPPGNLRRCDLRPAHVMSVNNDGSIPELERHSPRVHRYLDEVDIGNTNMAYLTTDGQRGIGHLTAGQRSVAYAMGLGLVWDAAQIGRASCRERV